MRRERFSLSPRADSTKMRGRMLTRRSCLSLALLGAMSVLSTGCPDADNPSGFHDEPQIRVTLDLSKGADNPSFLMSHGESHTFRKRVEDLEEQKNHVLPEPGKAGYQGLVLKEVGRGDGRPEYRVKNGWVIVTTGSGRKGFSDPKRSVESWVLTRGKRVVPQNAYDEVERDLESK